MKTKKTKVIFLLRVFNLVRTKIKKTPKMFLSLVIFLKKLPFRIFRRICDNPYVVIGFVIFLSFLPERWVGLLLLSKSEKLRMKAKINAIVMDYIMPFIIYYSCLFIIYLVAYLIGFRFSKQWHIPVIIIATLMFYFLDDGRYIFKKITRNFLK